MTTLQEDNWRIIDNEIDLFASVVQDDHMVLPTVSIAGSFQRQKKRTKNHSADADRIFMLVKNHVLAVSGMGDEAPPTPGGRNGGSDVL